MLKKLGVNGPNRYEFFYDKAGTMTKEKDYKNNLVHNYEYDCLGRLVRKNVLDSTSSGVTTKNIYFTEYGYDANDLRRLSGYTLGTDTAIPVIYGCKASNRNTAGQTLYQTEKIELERLGTIENKYVYDAWEILHRFYEEP